MDGVWWHYQTVQPCALCLNNFEIQYGGVAIPSGENQIKRVPQIVPPGGMWGLTFADIAYLGMGWAHECRLV